MNTSETIRENFLSSFKKARPSNTTVQGQTANKGFKTPPYVLVILNAQDTEIAAAAPRILYRKNNVWEHLPSPARIFSVTKCM